jgi:uncharacterized protein YuzE
MKMHYDPDADAMYIELVKSEVEKTKKIDENTLLDYDKKGNVIGVEILFVKERMPEFLEDVTIEKLSNTQPM